MQVTQTELTAQIGISAETVRRYESGVHQPNRWIQHDLERLARVHDVALDAPQR